MIKNSNLPLRATLTTGDYLTVVQGGDTYATTMRDVHNLFTTDPTLKKAYSYITSDLRVKEGAIISGDIVSLSNVNLGSNINNITYLQGKVGISGDSTVSGSVFIKENLVVSGGYVQLGTRETDVVKAMGNLIVSGTGYVGRNLHVGGNTTVNGDILVTGGMRFGADVTGRDIFVQSINVGDYLISNNRFSSLGTMTVGGTVSSQYLTVRDSASFGTSSANTFIINSRSAFRNNVYIQGDLSIRNNLEVSGSLRVTGSVYLGNEGNGITSILGDASIDGDVSLSEDLIVEGDATISGNLFSNQNLNCYGVNVIGTGFIGGKLNVGNLITIRSGLIIENGDLTVQNGNVSISGYIRDKSTYVKCSGAFSKTATRVTGIASSNLVKVYIASHGLAQGDYIYMTGANLTAAQELGLGSAEVTVLDINAIQYTQPLVSDFNFTYINTANPYYLLTSVCPSGIRRGALKHVARQSNTLYRIFLDPPYSSQDYFVNVSMGGSSITTCWVSNVRRDSFDISCGSILTDIYINCKEF